MKVKFHNPEPDCPILPDSSQEETCTQVVALVDQYNYLSGHSAIRFITPHVRHSGQAVVICRHQAKAYDAAGQRHSHRWSRGTRFWRQPLVV